MYTEHALRFFWENQNKGIVLLPLPKKPFHDTSHAAHKCHWWLSTLQCELNRQLILDVADLQDVLQSASYPCNLLEGAFAWLWHLVEEFYNVEWQCSLNCNTALLWWYGSGHDFGDLCMCCMEAAVYGLSRNHITLHTIHHVLICASTIFMGLTNIYAWSIFLKEFANRHK